MVRTTCGIVQVSVKTTKFGRGIEVNTLSKSGKKSCAKLNTSSFVAMELIIFKPAKTQSSSQSTGPKFVRAIKYRIVHFTIHRNRPSEGDLQIYR